MTDFISQAKVDAGLELPDDALQHGPFARSVVETCQRMPPGAVVAVQGPWGRGKTDVLARVALLSSTSDGARGAVACRPIWINPWQYGTPDLLTPLVIGLLERIPARQRRLDRFALRRAAESVVRAGASFGLKAAAAVIPGGKLIEAAEGPIDDLLSGWFSVSGWMAQARPDPDPVAKMAERFRELVDALVEPGEDGVPRLLICIDDLDRCLPHRQVALLEALRFLGSSGARTTTLVALDPTLARQAVVAHYGTEAFDPDLYLDKMFHFRITLPAMSPDGVRTLLRRDLMRRRIEVDGGLSLADWLTGQPSPYTVREVPQGWDSPATPPSLDWPSGFPLDPATRDAIVADAITSALQVQDLRSPRLLARMVERIHVLAYRDVALQSGGPREAPLWMSTPRMLMLFVLWLAIGERWPLVRAAMQAAGEPARWGNRLRAIFVRCWPPDEVPDRHGEASRKLAQELPTEVENLRAPGSTPGLRHCLRLAWQLHGAGAKPSGLGDDPHPLPGAFDDSLRCEGLAQCWADFDEILVDAGL